MISKRLLRYLLLLIIDNPIKIILLVLLILSSYFASNSSIYYNQNIKFIHSFKDNAYSYYVIPSAQNDSGFQVAKFEQDLPTNQNGEIIVESIKNSTILLWIAAGAIVITLTILSLTDIEEGNWSFEKNFIDLLHSDVKCQIEEIEGSIIYIYTLDGKLLTKTNKQLTDLRDLVKKYFKSPNLFVKFEGTKQVKRDNIINKVLNIKN
jgi:hypothetical protein